MYTSYSRSSDICFNQYKFPDSGCVSATWLQKQVPQQISANKRNFYWPNWVKTFQKWKAKGYDSETLGQKAKAWEEILTTFNSQNSDGVKRDLSQRQECWRRLKLQSKREHDLHRREAGKTGGVKALVILK